MYTKPSVILLLVYTYENLSSFVNQIAGEVFNSNRIFDYVSPGAMYTVVNGVKKSFTLK